MLLVDSIGELGALFRLADVVFMGGTLAHRGGHNVLEPAFFGKPVIVGPHMENFAEIAAKFRRRRGAVSHRPRRGARGRRGSPAGERGDARRRRRDVARASGGSERGATARAVAEIERWYWQSLPRYRVPAPARLLLWPLSRLWLLAGGWRESAAQ